jgi:hypothetical protein
MEQHLRLASEAQAAETDLPPQTEDVNNNDVESVHD